MDLMLEPPWKTHGDDGFDERVRAWMEAPLCTGCDRDLGRWLTYEEEDTMRAYCTRCRKILVRVGREKGVLQPGIGEYGVSIEELEDILEEYRREYDLG